MLELYTAWLPAFFEILADPFIAWPVVWSGAWLKIKVILNITSFAIGLYLLKSPTIMVWDKYWGEASKWKEASWTSAETSSATRNIIASIWFLTPLLGLVAKAITWLFS